jgi:ferritin-like metal-binding protein YciE
MAAVDSLHTFLVDELKDLRDAEEQLIKTLPRLAKMATAKPLRAAFQKHLAETRTHVQRLNDAMRSLGETPGSKTCIGMKGLLAEGEKVINQTPEGALRDAVLIAASQKVEHYEMASYGTARTYAEVLGEAGIARALQQTLREEKAADVTLTKIAETGVNEEAAEEWQSQSEDSAFEQSADWARGMARTASRGVSQALRSAQQATGMASDRRSGSRKTAGARKQGGGRKTSRGARKRSSESRGRSR